MSDSLKMPETLLAAGLEQAFRIGADKGAKEVVRLERQRGELLAALEALMAALKYVKDAHVPNIEHGKALARAALSKAKEGR